MSGKIKEKGMEILFLACALASIAAVAVICLFLFMGGIPAIGEIGAGEFLLGRKWAPQDVPASFGIFPMILGSVYVTAARSSSACRSGILAAVFLARFCPRPAYRVLGPAVQLMAGIPSIVYGFFGMVVIVPFIREHFRRLGAVNGSSILAASILLGIMILPTVIGVSESALRAVPQSYYEGALALGATHERAVFFAVLPAAKSGILAGVVLGVGRAIGETMAVIMVAGNQPRMPAGLFKGVRTLTANIVMEMGYASGLHREALIATGVVLFVFILLINLCFSLLKRRMD